MKTIMLLSLFIIAFSAHSAIEPLVSIEVKVNSHHGVDEKMTLKILKEGKERKLIVDDFNLPVTRILTNKKDLDTIVNFRPEEKTAPCGHETYSYIKTSLGKSTSYQGCPANISFQHLRKSFQNISAIR